MNKTIEKIFIYSIGFKPIFDLYWDQKVAGINLQSALLLVIPILLFFAIKNTSISRIFIPLIFFSIILLLNSIFLPEMIAVNLKFLLSFLYLFTIWYYAGNYNIVKKIFLLSFVSMLFISFISYLQFVGIVPYYYYTASIVPGQMTGRASGGYSHPNDYMRFFLPMVTFFFVLRYYNLLDKKLKFYLNIGFLFMLPAVILTYHRMSFFIIILFFIIDLIFRKKKKLLLGLSTVVIYFIIKYSDYLYYAIVLSRLRTQDGLEGLFNGGRLTNFYERVIGFMNADFANQFLGSGFYNGVEFGDNDFGRVLYSIGIFGFFFLIIYHLVYFLVIFFRRKHVDYYCLLLSGIMFFMLSLTTDPTRYPSLLLLYFLLVSAGLQSSFSLARNNNLS